MEQFAVDEQRALRSIATPLTTKEDMTNENSKEAEMANMY